MIFEKIIRHIPLSIFLLISAGANADTIFTCDGELLVEKLPNEPVLEAQLHGSYKLRVDNDSLTLAVVGNDFKHSRKYIILSGELGKSAVLAQRAYSMGKPNAAPEILTLSGTGSYYFMSKTALNGKFVMWETYVCFPF